MASAYKHVLSMEIVLPTSLQQSPTSSGGMPQYPLLSTAAPTKRRRLRIFFYNKYAQRLKQIFNETKQHHREWSISLSHIPAISIVPFPIDPTCWHDQQTLGAAGNVDFSKPTAIEYVPITRYKTAFEYVPTARYKLYVHMMTHFKAVVYLVTGAYLTAVGFKKSTFSAAPCSNIVSVSATNHPSRYPSILLLLQHINKKKKNKTRLATIAKNATVTRTIVTRMMMMTIMANTLLMFGWTRTKWKFEYHLPSTMKRMTITRMAVITTTATLWN